MVMMMVVYLWHCPLLPAVASGNYWAHDVVSIVAATIIKRRRMIVPKENSDNRKKIDINAIVTAFYL
jgi:hypothetical protein